MSAKGKSKKTEHKPKPQPKESKPTAPIKKERYRPKYA